MLVWDVHCHKCGMPLQIDDTTSTYLIETEQDPVCRDLRARGCLRTQPIASWRSSQPRPSAARSAAAWAGLRVPSFSRASRSCSLTFQPSGYKSTVGQVRRMIRGDVAEHRLLRDLIRTRLNPLGCITTRKHRLDVRTFEPEGWEVFRARYSFRGAL